MVAIAFPSRPLTTPVPVRSPVGPPSLRLVSPSGPRIDIGRPSTASTASTANVVIGVLLFVVAAFAVVGLVRSGPDVVPGDVAVLDGGHTVVAGETMWSIANDVAPAGEAGGYVERLVALNATSVASPGQILTLPVP